MAPKVTTLRTENQQGQIAKITNLTDRFAPPDNFRITVALQTTLELDSLINIFLEESASFVHHDSVVYRHADKGIVIATGAQSRHQSHYRLDLHGESLGEITFCSKKRFLEKHLMQIEYLLCALVYPLRNALNYHDIKRSAHKDPLTGLGNRAAMNDAILREIELARRNEADLALLAIDIDHFKRINDSFGHSVGDAVLKEVTERMREATRTSDLLFRYGGEEFVAVLAQTEAHHAEMVAERIRRTIADRPIEVNGRYLDITVSVGVTHRDNCHDVPCLFDKADEALYEAKRGGRNQVRTYLSKLESDQELD